MSVLMGVISVLCKVSSIIFCFFFILVSLQVSANESDDAFVPEAENIMADEGFGVEGEHFDTRTGNVYWETADISLPGAAGHDIALFRSWGKSNSGTHRGAANWEIETPRIEFVSDPTGRALNDVIGLCSDPDHRYFYDVLVNPPCYMGTKEVFRCSNDYLDPPGTPCRWRYQEEPAWICPPPDTQSVRLSWFSGLSLMIPGQAPKQLLYTRSNSHAPQGAKYISKDNWAVKCYTPEGETKLNGFRVTSPKGAIYDLEVVDYEQGSEGPYRHFFPTSALGEVINGQSLYGSVNTQIKVKAKKVVDVHGNAISYDYDEHTSNGGRWSSLAKRHLLKKIVGDDGRQIDLVYNDEAEPKVDSVTVNDQVWDYQYTPDGKHLNKVVAPDGSHWSYQYGGGAYTEHLSSLFSNDYFAGRSYLNEVVTPKGLKITYVYEANSGKDFGLPRAGSNAPTVNSVKKRTSNAIDVPKFEVEYDYTQENNENVTTVSGDRYEKHTFSRDSKLLGSPLRKYVYFSSGGVVEQLTEYQWEAAGPIGSDGFYGYWQESSEYRPLLKARKMSRPGTDDLVFTRRIFDYNEFGFPGAVVEFGNGPWQRTEYKYKNLDTYSDNSKWIIGLNESIQFQHFTSSDSFPYAIIANSRPVTVGRVDKTFYSSGLVKTLDEFGLSKAFEYYADGNLKKIKHQRLTNASAPWVEHEYSDYKLGVAQAESLPLSYSRSRTVGDFGRITSETDEDGNTTSFTYDSVGRLKTMAVPGQSIETHTWESPKVQNISKAGYREKNTYDSFGRIISSEKFDSAKPNDKIYVIHKYDKLGNKVFESQRSSLPSETRGERKSYDALGRVLSLTDTADGDVTAYFYGKKWNDRAGAEAEEPTVRLGFGVIDGRGYAKVYHQIGYGDPMTTKISRIDEQAELSGSSAGLKYISTNMLYTRLGNVLQLEQSGLKRTFKYYDNRPTLLKNETHPEIGMITYTYDRTGNMLTRKVGSQPKTTYNYDDLNRLQLINYPASTNDIDLDYYPSGDLRFIDTGVTRWNYEYNGARQITSETLDLIGGNFTLGYEYDALGNNTIITYPNGVRIDHAPDVFGRATKVGRYVSSVKYQPNGALAEFKYRNGFVTTIAPNNKNFPDEISSVRGNVFSVKQKYTYDKNDNVTKILDYVDPTAIVDMNYDGLGRLGWAESLAWNGKERFEYDGLGNILAKTIGANTFSYEYDTTKNRLISASGGYSFQYDGYGNIKSNGKNLFTYDHAGRLVSVNNSPNIEYIYDGHGHRVSVAKSGSSNDVEHYSVYSKDGKLMYREDVNTGYSTNYYYLNGRLALTNVDCSVLDSDSDGIPDCVEEAWGLNKNDSSDAMKDLDSDGLKNIYEYAYDYNPQSNDTDGDGQSDFAEVSNDTNSELEGDSDNDGLSDLEEVVAGTNPLNSDTDGDGLIDGVDSNPTLNVAVLTVIINNLLL